MSARTVLLISANRETVPAPVYPGGMARLAGALQQAGHRVAQFDVLVDSLESLPRVLDEMQPHLAGVSLRNVDNLTSGQPQSYAPFYREVIRTIRSASSVPVVLGGSGFSLFPDRFLHELGADYGIVGPGEQAICSLLEMMDGAVEAGSIPNLLTASGRSSRSRRTDSPPAALPEAVFSLHDRRIIDFYWRTGGMIGVQTKIGCPRSCSYCTYPVIEGRSVCHIDVCQVAGEIERLVSEFGIRYVFFADSLFNLCREYELSLAGEIRRRGLEFSWGAFFSPSRIDGAYLAELKRSGLTHVEFGTDSLCDAMLQSYGKDFRVRDVFAAAAACSELEIHCAHYIILGGPGENDGTVLDTMRNAERLPRSVMFPFSGIRLYPRTDLHAVAVREGVIAPDDDCFEPRFYEPPGVDLARIWEIVAEAAGHSHHRWVMPTEYASCVGGMKRMRRHGFKGPLWEYLLHRVDGGARTDGSPANGNGRTQDGRTQDGRIRGSPLR